MPKTIFAEQLNALSTQASDAPRKRSHLNMHESLDAKVQRLFIATEPDTYIRPHRHSQDNKWELFTLLEGEMDLLIFDDEGQIVQRITMSRTGLRSVEIPPNTWHSYVCKQSGTVALEIKEGPYIPNTEGDFLATSPAENTPEAVNYLNWMREAEALHGS